MSSTLLERTRASHEELERLQRTLITDLKTTPKTHKGGVNQSHRVNHLLDRIVETSTTLEKIYVDADGSRKDGIASIAGSGPSLYSLFYDRLREIREYHRKYPNLEVERPENLHIPPPNVAFSGAEKYGKFLDLNELFIRYMNLEGFDKMDYLTYLYKFNVFDKLPASRLYNKQYKSYIDAVHAYLVSYFERTQPLMNLEKEIESAVKAFEAKWASGELQNGNATNNNNNATTTTTPAPTPAKPTPAAAHASSSTDSDKKKKNKSKSRKRKDKDADPEPASAPMEVDSTPKKIADFDNPLYCRACAKLFSKDTVFKGHLSGKKHIQAEQDVVKLRKDILLGEHRISAMVDMLEDTIRATHANVQHWQSLTGEERLTEQVHEEEDDEEPEEDELPDYDDDDDEPIRMTIKDYPIGWDGKPIPYWLYKLHGLGVEYKCEICGNTSYFGRKNFERHFQESRHAHGMACLNIPNSKHFQEITKISDAVALWAKIREDNKKMEWRPDAEEECEDSEGHVMAKKTFDDLRRQGLLD